MKNNEPDHQGRLPRPRRRRGRADPCKIEDGQVTDVKLNIFEPPRFFEAFLRGRDFTRGARHHRAHLRHLPGRLPDERRATRWRTPAASRSTGTLRELRRLLYCGEWIESHALHVYMLHAPDFLGYEDAHRTWRRTTPRSVQRGAAS